MFAGAPSADGRPRLVSIAQLAPFGILSALLVGIPLLLLITYSFRESSFLGVGDGPTLDQYRAVFEGQGSLRVMFKTLYVGLGVAAIVTTFAFALSYAITFRMGRRAALIALGIVVASGVASFLCRIFAWGIVLGNNGLANGALDRLGLIESPLDFLYFGQFAIGVTMVYVYLPIAALIVYSAMQEIDPRSVEASRDLGAGRWRTVFRIVAPQARIGIFAAFAVTMILASGDFVTPRIVGGTSGVMVGAEVQDLTLVGGDLPGAAALALSFIVLALGALLLLAILTRLAPPVARAVGRRVTPVVNFLSRHRASRGGRRSVSRPIAILLLVYLTVPTILVVIFSFNESPSVGLPFTGFTVDWYSEIVGREGFSEALRGSVTVTAIATLGSLLIGIPVAFALVRLRGFWSRLTWAAVLVLFVVPGTLLGSALLVATAETGFPTGLGLTAMVHSLLLVSVVVIVVYARLESMDRHIVEAARDLGASTWRVARTVTLPLLLPSIVGAAVLGAAYSLDEVFVTQFTVGSDNTLPIWLFGQARRGFTPGVYGVGVLLLAGTILAFVLAITFAKRSVLATRGG